MKRKFITSKDFSAGRGISKNIATGVCLMITKHGKVMARLRPVRKGDEGQKLSMTDMCHSSAKFAQKAQAGKSYIVVSRGKNLAVLEAVPAKKPRAQKRRTKPPVQAPPLSTPPASPAPTSTLNIDGIIKVLSTVKELGSEQSAELLSLASSLKKAGQLGKALAILKAFQS